MNALALSILGALSLLVLFGSKRWAALAIVAGILYLTQGMALVVAGFSLYPIRVLLLAAAFRIAIRREFPSAEINGLDKILVVLYVYAVGVFVLRSKVDLVYQIGTGVDALMAYFVFRSLMRTIDDAQWLLKGLVFLLLPYVPLVWIETLTSSNPFVVVGGVENANAGDMWFRGGRLRATGAFGHPSLLGTLGGSFLPLYISLFFKRGARSVAWLGSIACLAIVGAANSGGPAICVAMAVVGWFLWPLRTSMKWVRRGILLVLALLAMVMNAPIWYIIAKVSSLTGGDGWHRAALLDVGFAHLDKWWLAGMPMTETSNWLPYNNGSTGYVDMTDNFLQFGVNSGVFAMLLLIASLAVAFDQIGTAMAVVRKNQNTDSSLERFVWGLGVVLLVHIFNWFGITYWDQTNALWFLHLAIMSSVSGSILLAAARETPSDLAIASMRDVGSRPPQRNASH